MFRLSLLAWCGLAFITLGAPVTTTDGMPTPDALAEQARLRVAPGLKVELWAGEPLVQNLTSFCFDSVGRAYVVETGRRRTSVFDVRGLQPWLDDDYALRTVADRAAFLRRMLTPGGPGYDDFTAALSKSGMGGFKDFNHDGVTDWRDLEVETDRIRLVWDSDGDGRADKATTFADGFTNIINGVAAGVLVHGTNVWFTCIPDLWKFSVGQLPVFSSNSAAAQPSPPENWKLKTEKLLSGFGVHIASGGHDLHGLIKGPDGRIYFSVADRGSCVTNREGRVFSLPDCGAVFRCEEDGSDMEVFAKGLRNPQKLCFDDYGNLWTCDNNGDGGDKARWTLVLEGADYGWTIGWQNLPKMGAWNSERLWHTRESNTAAYLVPPVAYVGHGPAGIAHYPGTGLPARYDGHFFVTDFPGGVRTFTVEPDGAFFKVVPEPGADPAGRWLEDNSAANLTGKLLWDLSPVDIVFPPGGGVTVADWVQGWEKTGKGRLWHVFDPALVNDPLIAETKRLLAEGMAKRSEKELLALLGHRDQRVRLEAQWELAGRGVSSFKALRRVAFESKDQLVRIHALWAIGQIGRQPQHSSVLDGLLDFRALLEDHDSAIQEATIRMFGETRLSNFALEILRLSTNSDSRVSAAAFRVSSRLYDVQSRNEGVYIDSAVQTALKLANAAKEKVKAELRSLTKESGPYTRSIVFTGASIQPTVFIEALATVAVNDLSVRDAKVEALGNLNKWGAPIFAVEFEVDSRSQMLGLLARRRLSDPGIRIHLRSPHPQLVLEAARAINDVPIPGATSALSGLLTPTALDRVVWGTNTLNFTRDEWRTWVLRRAVNANFRLGEAANAAALAEFTARADAPESVRIEALDDLADWAKPPGRDKIVGLWRPLPPRDPAPARNTLAIAWKGLAADTSTNVVLAAVHAGAALGIDAFADKLAALRQHPSPAVRAEAARLADANAPADVPALIARLDGGTVAERQAAFAALGRTTDPTAVAALTGWVRQLVEGKVPADLQLDVLEAARNVGQASRLSSPGDNAGGTPALLSALAVWANSLPKGDPLTPYRPALAGGDPARGRKVFTERQDLACFRCHKFKGDGGEVGPELSGIGRTKGREYVLRSILFPNAEIAAGFENLVLTRKDGSSVIGVLKSETPAELVVESPEDGRVTVKKADLASRERGPSSMIEGLGELMSPRDLRDVVAALSE